MGKKKEKNYIEVIRGGFEIYQAGLCIVDHKGVYTKAGRSEKDNSVLYIAYEMTEEEFNKLKTSDDLDSYPSSAHWIYGDAVTNEYCTDVIHVEDTWK